jgi:hypothetical protein
LSGTGKTPVKARSLGALRPGLGPVAMSAPKLEIDPQKRRIVAPQGARAVSGKRNATIFARRIEGDMGLSVLTATGEVRASGAQGEFRSDKATWNAKTGRASASGRVTASNPASPSPAHDSMPISTLRAVNCAATCSPAPKMAAAPVLRNWPSTGKPICCALLAAWCCKKTAAP